MTLKGSINDRNISNVSTGATLNAKLTRKITVSPGEEKIIKVHTSGKRVKEKSIFESNQWIRRLGIVAKNQEVLRGSKIMEIMAV